MGLSGGVDSSVAAALLLEQGHEVIGIFMKNWHDTDVTISDDCPWEEDSKDALLVAEKLGISFQTIDLSAEYKNRIVDYMFDEYGRGRTPNPDVLCNREIKFDVFLETALKLGADFVATGHYCRKRKMVDDPGAIEYQLVAGADLNKDQSYFLCQINQYQLSKALFPIGHLTKPEVRELATKYDLITAGKRDSQGLCFIGKVRLPDFLQQQLKPKEGKIIEILDDSPMYDFSTTEQLEKLAAPITYMPTDGTEVGKHQGAQFYTIGQRKGLRVGGKPEPLFVLATNVNDNLIYVGMGDDHPGLKRTALFVSAKEVHWVNPLRTLQTGEQAQYQCRIRYRQPLQKATLICTDKGVFVQFYEAQKAIAAGQFVAWYDQDVLVGSGVINA